MRRIAHDKGSTNVATQLIRDAANFPRSPNGSSKTSAKERELSGLAKFWQEHQDVAPKRAKEPSCFVKDFFL